MTNILTVATTVPPYSYTTSEILPFAERWLGTLPPTKQKKALKIFAGAQVEKRHSIRPLDEIFSPQSFAEKNNSYIRAILELVAQAFEKALIQANLDPQAIDCLITTSCTGFMIPSVDAYLINRYHLRQDVLRLPVTEMGCAGGTAGLIYANDYLKAYPEKKVALISAEAASITLQLDDYSMENIVSAAIFADGAACCILGGDKGPAIRSTQMYHFPDTTHLMGFELRNSGFKIVLDRAIPRVIEQHIPRLLEPFLAANEVPFSMIEHFIFHPGGKKIVQSLSDYIQPFGKNLQDSLYILKNYGNLSSATVLFILERALKKHSPPGTYGLAMAFGPGFTAHSLLLHW